MSATALLVGLGALLFGGPFLWAVVTGGPPPTAALMAAPLAPVEDLADPPLPTTPNWAFALPPGATRPDGPQAGAILTAPRYPLSADALFRRATAMVEDLPNVTVTHRDPVIRRLDAVARTRWLGFPDTISLQVVSLEDDSASVLVLGRSRLGYSDLGTNARRITDWLDRLMPQIHPPN
ncbi:MAG: DUF1499 domain-containing protein [Rhodospirillum sp.]|nr:DUF1499 domain-containing protein [Rhodospirillum sp.]MCF8489810.1 DUF1499 domain-containing protein [Rhodospirillum sp.]MCF8501615.1 DUF1499 domain-containing protein [Rhodospirillum sp.]